MNTVTITLAAEEGVDLEEAYYQLSEVLHEYGLKEI
jgi:hypothetical protein